METINIELPEAVSRSIIEEIDWSLNILFPKLFCIVDIKEESVEIVIPSVSGIKIPLTLFKIATRTPVKYIEIYTISFPLIGKVYKLSHDKKKNEIEWLYRIGEKDYPTYSKVLEMDGRNYSRVLEVTQQLEGEEK